MRYILIDHDGIFIGKEDDKPSFYEGAYKYSNRARQIGNEANAKAFEDSIVLHYM